MEQEKIHYYHDFFEPEPIDIDEMVRQEELEQVKRIAENMKDLKEMTQMLSEHINKDQEQLDQISSSIENTENRIEYATNNLEDSLELYQGIQKNKIIFGGIVHQLDF